MSAKILVTGADGFIGSHLVEALVRQGRSVRAFVFYNSLGSWGWLDEAPQDIKRSFEVVTGDIRDGAAVKEAMRGCEAVLHLAALIGIPYSYRAPESYVDTNIAGTLNVLQAARELGTQKVVHTSTSEVYGTAQSVPIGEHHPLHAQSPYAATKIAADQLALSFHSAFGTPVAVARPFNTYGPRQSARAVIPTIIAQLVAGDRVSLGALHPTRDFSFVSDTVAGLIAVADNPSSIAQVINIGSGFEISIGYLAEIIASLVGRQLTLTNDPDRLRPSASEVERLLADISKARQLLGWQPAFGGIGGLKRGLAKTIEWYREPDNLRRYRADAYAI